MHVFSLGDTAQRILHMLYSPWHQVARRGGSKVSGDHTGESWGSSRCSRCSRGRARAAMRKLRAELVTVTHLSWTAEYCQH